MEILAALDGIGDRISAILRQTGSLQHRAMQLAEMLRSCSPSTALSACLLQANNDSFCCVMDQTGNPRDAWAELLYPDLHRHGEGEGKRTGSGKLPPALKLSGYSLACRPIAAVFDPDALAGDRRAPASVLGSEQHNWGVLALAIPKNTAPDELAQVRALLTSCSELVALRLLAEAQAHRLETLQRELAGQAALASTGELASPLTHEFNNFLNIVLLHVALLETEVPEKLRPELIELRRQGATMTRLVKQFQQHRRRLHSVLIPADLNRLVHEAVGIIADRPGSPGQALEIRLPPSSQIEFTGLGRPSSVPLTLELAADLPLVHGSPADLKRLCTFLLTNAAAAAGSAGGSVALGTHYNDSHVFLRVEDTGPPISPDALHQVFEPATAGRPETNSLELAACESLARRLQGRIRCENRLEGGVAVIVELPRIPS